MKKIFFITLFCLVVLIGCNTNTANSNRKEVIELAKLFSFNDEIDTINLYSLKAKVHQTIFETGGLCRELSSGEYGWYYGQVLCYMSNEQLYDNKIINKNVIYLGTFRYEGRDFDYHVVPLYCDIEVYKNGIVDKIKEIQKNKTFWAK